MRYWKERWQDLRGALRQWRYAREFRIERAVWEADWLTAMAALAEQLRQLPEPQAAAAVTSRQELPQEHLQMLADVGTGLWRLKQKLLEPGSQRPAPEMRRAFRHLESTWDALQQSGVKIQDHTGLPFDSGLSLQVVAFQPLPAMQQEQVIETIRPTIYYQGNCIQMGQVVVGTPEQSG